MDKKTNNKKTVQAYPDIPSRTFDLLPRFVEKYGKKKVMFASKVDGSWKKYISRDFVKMTDVISQGLIGLGVGKGDRVALVSNNCPQWNMVDLIPMAAPMEERASLRSCQALAIMACELSALPRIDV